MIIQPYDEVIVEPRLLGNTTFVCSNLPQQTIQLNLATDNPIEAIKIRVAFIVKSAITTLVADGLFNILRKVTLSVTEPSGPRLPISLSGPALLELASFEGYNLDGSTLKTLEYTNNNNVPQGAIIQVTYRIHFPLPRCTDTFRMRSLLPAHLYNESPVLTLEFGQATDLSTGTADPIVNAAAQFACNVTLEKRRKTSDFLAKGGGSLEWFIRSWQNEQTLNIGVSQTAVEQRFQFPVQGQISGALIRFFKGNATMARASIDDVTTLGSETIWRLEQGGVPITKFRLKDIQAKNQMVKPQSSSAQFALRGGAIASTDTGPNTSADGVTAGAPPVWVTGKQLFAATGFGGALSVGQCIQDPASVFLDFTGAGGNEVYETGSFLDVSTPTASKQKTELVGTVTTPANQQSAIKLTTRLYEDKVNELAVL